MDQYLEFNGIPGNYKKVKDKWDDFSEAQKYVVDKLFSTTRISVNNNNKNKILLFLSCIKIYILEKKTPTDIMPK